MLLSPAQGTLPRLTHHDPDRTVVGISYPSTVTLVVVVGGFAVEFES